MYYYITVFTPLIDVLSPSSTGITMHFFPSIISVFISVSNGVQGATSGIKKQVV